MPMPSLFKYFAFVGAALLGLLSLTNFLLDPSTGASAISQQVPAKPTVTVRHDPRASRIERWRNEQAALKASEPTATTAKPAPQTVQPQPVSATASAAAKPAPAVSEPVQPVAQPAVAQVAAPQAPTPVAAASAATPAADAPPVMASTDDALRAEKRKAAAAKAKKARLARERARIEQAQAAQPATGGQFYGGWQQRNASNQQDQYYYGQRVQPQQRQTYNAYAPRQGFGPFSQW
jgi:hypothetical protein